MDSWGRDAGAPDAPAIEDTPAPGGLDEAVGPDDGQTAEHAPASGGTSASPGDREQLGDVRPAAADDDEPVAVDPLPSTGSLVWADDTATALRPGRAAEMPTATAREGRDDTTEVITPDQVVPPPYGADETAPPGWALPPRNHGRQTAATWARWAPNRGDHRPVRR